MVGVPLDRCVLSEAWRPQGAPQVRAMVGAIDPERAFVSAITVGELTKGIARLPASRRRRELAAWLLGLEQRDATKILPVDADVARELGELTARAETQGVRIPVSDGLIAATALRHGLHVMTRNSRHFAASGASIIDPWEGDD